MVPFIVEHSVEELQGAFPDDKIPENIFKKIFYAALYGRAKLLVAVLNELPSRKICNYVLNMKFRLEDGKTVTPLVMGAQNGNLKMVRTMFFNYELDLEVECGIRFDGLNISGATALWAAAGNGHLEIVKFLVKHGADVHHNTEKNSSPLRAACYEGHLDIVHYLIAHGADVNLANTYHSTSIMIAASKGCTAVVETLLKYGADPNKQARCGATALHYAAESGHTNICELLLDHGAKVQKNEHGMTPVMDAAERSFENVVQMFLNRPNLMTKEEKIDALELLGAAFANDKDNYNVVKAFQYMMNGMELRFQDPDKIIRKRTLPPVLAYDNWIETETVEELQAIRLNHHSIHMESLTVRERILGKNNPDLPQPIVYRGAIFADQERFEMCCNLWIYAIDLRSDNGLPVDIDLLRFAQLLSQMIRLEKSIDISLVTYLLSKCQAEIEKDSRIVLNSTDPGNAKENQSFKQYMNDRHTAIYLIKITSILLANKSCTIPKQKVQELFSIISKIIEIDPKFGDGRSLLHRAVAKDTLADDFYTREVCRFPCFKTALLLLHIGAPVSDIDYGKDTALHTLVKTIIRDNKLVLNEAEKIIKLFIKAGGHLDAVNASAEMPVECATVASVQKMVLTYTNKTMTLKCLAARTVAFCGVPFKNIVPNSLEEFIEIHGPYSLSS